MSFNPSKIKSVIDTYGHMVLGVGSAPPFAYSIGLYEKHGFELIMIGLRQDFAARIINDIAEYLKSGKDLDLCGPHDEFANMPNLFRMCVPDRVAEYAVQAGEYYEKPVPVVQFVMCDREGRFPGDPLYDHQYMDPRQPLLY